MKELDPHQYQAIEEFAQNLTECFISYKNNHPDTFSDIVLNYVINVIQIHLELADLKLRRYGISLEKAQNKA